MTITNKDTGRKNIPKLFLPLDLNSSTPKIAIKIPSNNEDAGLYEKSFVIKPYAEIIITNKTSITLTIFNLVPPYIIFIPIASTRFWGFHFNFNINIHIYKLTSPKRPFVYMIQPFRSSELHSPNKNPQSIELRGDFLTLKHI